MTAPQPAPRVSVVVPIFNEQEVIGELRNRLIPVLEPLGSFEVLLINDGSTDETPLIVDEICMADARLKAIHFSRNFGHQAAVTAGLRECSGRCAVVIDADLQDPPQTIQQMVDKWDNAFDVVYAVRRKREGDGWFKRSSAFVFYRLLGRLTEVEVPPDSGDFCLLDRRVLDVLNAMPERNRYLRGLRAWVGFRQTELEFDRAERFAGKTKYPFKKMVSLAFNGIFSLSKAPLRLAMYFGIGAAVMSFLLGLFFLIGKVTGTVTVVRGWASTIVAVLFLGGVQLICIGAVGEYIGRIYDEVKQRPLYVIARTTGVQ
jgi:polyisoprenyl-phosphate glycosyltransferase